jgi:hypothetical protein
MGALRRLLPRDIFASAVSRPMLRPALFTFCSAAFVSLNASLARAQSAEAVSKTSSAEKAASTPVPPLSGFQIVASAGYGASTAKVGRLDVAPYGASFGLELGYGFRRGFRLGAYGSYGAGHAVTQDYDPRNGRPFEVTADTSLASFGLFIGYDVPLYSLVLRYELKLGGSVMQWAFGDARPKVIEYYALESPSTGFHAAPGLSLLAPLGSFEVGVGFDYFAQVNDAIPAGFVGLAFAGVRL